MQLTIPKFDPGCVSDHRRIMETLLDRPLAKHEVVHHINSDHKDNYPGNLLLCANSHVHATLHLIMRKRPDLYDIVVQELQIKMHKVK